MKAIIKLIGNASGLGVSGGWQFESSHAETGTVAGQQVIAGWTLPELIAVSAVNLHCGETVALELAKQLARGAKD